MLGFLVPILGLGNLPTILVLTFYATYPLLRSTYTGLQNVPAKYSEAADALGFSTFQKIRFVELPLALPTIISGLRIATSMTIGIATISAFIGAGGLGDFITQGLSLNDTSLILLGAIPTALLALGFDFGISQFEKFLLHRKQKSFSFSLLTKTFALILLVIAAFLGFSTFSIPSKNTIVVASKNFTEQYILAELIAQLLEEKTSLKVVRKFNMGSTDILHQALLRGDIDIYPEYTGTAYLTILKESPTQEKIFEKVRSAYKEKFKILWLDPFGFSNKPTFAIRKELSQKYNIHSISDLQPYSNQFRIAAPPEFLKRADQFPGLNQTYKLNFKKIMQVDPNLMYAVIEHKSADIIAAAATDGKLKKYDLDPLLDDKGFYISYDAAPLIRETALFSYPEIQEALQPILGFITEEKMKELNYKVDVEGQPPAKVVQQFLKTFHFL